MYVFVCLLVYYVCVLCAHEQMQYHSQKITLGSWFSLVTFTWLLEMKLRLPGMPSKHIYPLSQSTGSPYLSFETGCLTDTGAYFSGWSGQGCPWYSPVSILYPFPTHYLFPILSLFPTHYLGLQVCAAMPRFCFWCWGFKPGFSCLHSKCFANLAISLTGLKTKQNNKAIKSSVQNCL